MPVSQVSASVWTEEDEADQDMTTNIDEMDIDELCAQFGSIMAEVVTYHGDDREVA